MNKCRVSWKGSGVVFGQAAFHVVDRYPKTTPDPVAYRTSKSDTFCFAGPWESLACRCLRVSVILKKWLLDEGPEGGRW
jgi:hypothetical protein